MLPQVLERVRRGRELRKALGAAERDLVRAERLAAIGEMTVTLHHGINNPLMSASADVELLLAEPEMPEPQRRRSLTRSRSRSTASATSSARSATSARSAPSPTCPGSRWWIWMARRTRAGAHRGTALVQVPEEDLARIVALLLRHAGFVVERCAPAGRPAAAASRLGVSLVLVLGGTDAAGAHPLGGFDPPARRDYRVVALVAGDGAAARAAGADRVIELPFDPGSFTADMVGHRRLRRSGRRQRGRLVGSGSPSAWPAGSPSPRAG